MNELPFSPHTKRMPVWGLGCVGVAADLSRAHEYCLAFFQIECVGPTVLFVLKEHLKKGLSPGERGLAAALRPCFSKEMLLLEWQS